MTHEINGNTVVVDLRPKTEAKVLTKKEAEELKKKLEQKKNKTVLK